MGTLSRFSQKSCRTCLLSCSSLHSYTSSDCPNGTCDPWRALAELDVEISDLEAKLAKCSQQRRDLKTTINSHHDRLIHSFPFEIASHIFRYVVEDDNPKYQKSDLKYPGLPVLVLGAVCKRLRQITLNAPELWKKVIIDVSKHASDDCVEVTEALIARSRPLPLLLKIRAEEKPFIIGEKDRDLERVSSILKPESARWSALNLAPCVSWALLDGLEQDPKLETLRVFGKSNRMLGQANTSQSPSTALFHTRFNPLCLYITTFSLLVDVPLRCERLVYLEASMIAANELLHIVRNAPNLHTLSMKNVTRANDLEDFPMPTSHIVHNSLTRIDAESSMYIGILRYLTLPALERLSHAFRTIMIEFDGFFDCLQRSKFNSLTRLSIFYQLMEPENPYMDGHWYNDIPSLTHLRLTISWVGPQTANNLISIVNGFTSPLDSRRRPIAFPLLQELHILAPILSKQSWSHLYNIIRPVGVDMVSARPVRQIWVEATQHRYNHAMDVAMSREDCIGFAYHMQYSGIEINFRAERRDAIVDLLDEHRKLYEINNVKADYVETFGP